MMYIDLHCHLDFPTIFEDIDNVITEAKNAGLKVVVASGIHPESNRKALELAERFPMVRASCGLYPIDALEAEVGESLNIDIDSEIAFLKANRDKIAAIGEIGLDYQTGSDKERQKKLFRQMLDLAAELKKPVIIHSRKAEQDALDMLADYGLLVILHCFSGKKRLVKEGNAREYFFTVPTHVVRSDQIQNIVREVPLSRLFCETDAPFLSPFKGKRNEPAFVVESYKKIAEIKGLELKETANIIYQNWQQVFG